MKKRIYPIAGLQKLSAFVLCSFFLLSQSLTAVIARLDVSPQKEDAFEGTIILPPNDGKPFHSLVRDQLAFFKDGSGVLTLDGSLSFQGITEISHGTLTSGGSLDLSLAFINVGTLVLDDSQYDPLENSGSQLIFRYEPAHFLPKNSLLISDFGSTSFEASSLTAVPEHSTTGLLVGLLSAAYVVFTRRSTSS